MTYAITIWILVFNERRRQQRNKNMDIAQAALLTLMLVIALCVRNPRLTRKVRYESTNERVFPYRST